MKKICVISDIHEQWDKISIPKCDLLITAGDLTYRGDFVKVSDFNLWAAKLKSLGVVKEVVTIAGNHDLTAQDDPETFRELLSDVVYLCDELYNFDGIKIYGSPWTPSFFREFGWVFNADRGDEIKSHWEKIPNDVDILATHGPPFGILDNTPSGERVGCKDLKREIEKKKPRVCVFGHIHNGYGAAIHGETFFINASTCNERYEPTNIPILFQMSSK